MADASAVLSPGQADASGDIIALNLEKFSGMVLGLLDDKLVMLDTVTVKQAIAGAKTALFPTFGDAAASYHVPGEDVLGTGSYLSTINVGEHQVHVDRRVYAGVFLDDLEDKLNHWDHMSAFAAKLSTAVAEQYEDRVFRTVMKGANDDVEGTALAEWPAPADAPGATTSVSGVTLNDISSIYDQAWLYAEQCDAYANAPLEGRFGVVHMADYYGLLRFSETLTAEKVQSVINRDVTNGLPGGLERPPLNGIWIANTFIMPTNLMPTTTADATFLLGASADNNYNDVVVSGKNFRQLFWTKDSVGAVVASAPALDIDRIPQNLGRLISLHQSMGMGVLRPETCRSVRVTS